MFDGESDYVVEDYIRPAKVRVPLVNDERADLLGNFDDTKRKAIERGESNNNNDFEENPFADDGDADGDDDVDEEDAESSAKEEVADSPSSDTQPEGEASGDAVELPEATAKKSKPKQKKEKPKGKKPEGDSSEFNKTGHLSDAQITALVRGASKSNRYVLYVTNLNYETSKTKLEEFFSNAGEVKSVRIPKTRKSAFAFVEMDDIDGFKVTPAFIRTFKINILN